MVLANTDNLRKILLTITKNDEVLTSKALNALSHAIDEFKRSRYVVDAHGRRSKPGIAESRKAVKTLHRKLREARDIIDSLPLDAVRAVIVASRAPFGAFTEAVVRCEAIVATATSSLMAQPGKTPDVEKRILALSVATVFEDVLKIAPAATRDTDNAITSARGGATYAKVLRATFEASGVYIRDLGPYIDAGRTLLDDPWLPRALPESDSPQPLDVAD